MWSGTALFIALLLPVYGCIEVSDKSPEFKIIPNPNCDVAKGCSANETKLIQVIVTDPPANSVHFLLPGNGHGGPLSIVMIEAPPKPSKLEVDWTRFTLNNGTAIWNSIKLKDVITSYGVVFYEFCVYKDLNDDAKINDDQISNECHHFLGKNIYWTLTFSSDTSKGLRFIYTALNSTDSMDKYGSIIVNITIPRSLGELPESGYSLTPAKGIIFEVTLDKIQTQDRERVAPIILPFSQDPVKVDEDFLDSMSLSAGGKETLYNIHLNKRRRLQGYEDPGNISILSHTSAFLQWKTTCSVSPDGKTKSRVETSRRMMIPPHLAKKYQYALPYAFYGDAFNQKNTPDFSDITVGLRLQALSTGRPKDGFYRGSNYTMWRGILSFGEPNASDDEGFRRSLAVGLSLSVIILLMMALALGFYIYRRRKGLPSGSDEDGERLIASSVARGGSGIPMPCLNGRLRFCRRIPSPNLSRDGVQ